MLIDALITFIPIFISVVLHEVAHGYAALSFGDDTAKRCGRLSLNPVDHVDFWGTIVLPLVLWYGNAPFLFGWARPVPVDFRKLRDKKLGIFTVATAGVVVNAVLAGLAILIMMNVKADAYSEIFLSNLLGINLALIFLNILPFPPLDGSKMFFGWMDAKWARRYVAAEREGLMVLVFLIAVVPLVGGMMGMAEVAAFNPLDWYMRFMFNFVLELL